MTFKESEHINIIERLAGLSDADIPMDEIIKETWKLERRIPLYPGIVVMCMNSVIENDEPGKLKPGEKVILTTGKGQYVGTIKEISDDEIILQDATFYKREDKVSVKKNELGRVEKINKKTLEKVWPSLVFKER
ncbi:MAG: hypothetical protein AB1633_00970 [Elusimicrobiota bacterium]